MNRHLILSLTTILLLFLGVATAGAQDPVTLAPDAPEAPTGTAFTYQGQLHEGSTPASGLYDFRFTLYRAADGGSPAAEAMTVEDVTVTEGLFTVPLDFGSAPFDGRALYLEIAVRPGSGDGDFTTLAPRQRLTPAPFALWSQRAPWSGLMGMPAGFADGVDNDTTYSAGAGLSMDGTTFRLIGSYRLPQGCTAGQSAEWDGTAWVCGTDDVASSSFWSLTGNGGTNPANNFLGTTNNRALELRVNNQRALRLEPNATAANVIGGFGGNDVAEGVAGATIAGGGSPANPNIVGANFATVGGGENNQAMGQRATVAGGYLNVALGFIATVGGGFSNQASGEETTVAGGSNNEASGLQATVGGGVSNEAGAPWTTVAGGHYNQATDSGATVAGGGFNVAAGSGATVGGGSLNRAVAAFATVAGGGRIGGSDDTGNHALDQFATVGGGGNNRAGNDLLFGVPGPYATVGGGANNRARGPHATVPGGDRNEANGAYSFAAGRRAQAMHAGAFVWADAADASIASGGDNQFVVRANGGIWLGRSYANEAANIPAGRFLQTSTGAHLTNGGAWSNASDIALKENFSDVNTHEILERLLAMPISTWNYRAEEDAVRHLGPTAQDFAAAFGLGADDTSISTVDANGVALAAIQALAEVVDEKDARIAELEARLSALEQRSEK